MCRAHKAAKVMGMTSDDAPQSEPETQTRKREPILTAPAVIIGVILLLVGVHGARAFMSPAEDIDIILTFSFIPARFSLMLDPDGFAQAVRAMLAAVAPGEAPQVWAMARQLVNEDAWRVWTLLTYAGLHGSWPHVLMNCAWLLAFGTPVARRLGTLRTCVLLALTAIAGALFHWAIHRYALVPVVGASAAASGLMAGACRFAFPGDQRGGLFGGQHHAPMLSIAGALRNRRVALFIGVWMATNLIFGILAVPLGLSDAGIAWEAHIGGFLAGFLLIAPLDKSVPDQAPY